LREDHRGLADLIGHTRVVDRALATEDLDGDSRLERLAAERRTRRIFTWFEVGAVIAAVAVQFLLGLPVAGNASQLFAERQFRERAEKRFEENPGDPDLARDLIERLEQFQDDAGVQRARQRHQSALAEADRAREIALRESLARDPRHEEALISLLQLLEDQARIDDARLAYSAFVEAGASPRERVRFGAWLQRRGFAAEAARQLDRALREGETINESYGVLGLALRDLGRTDEARAALSTALAGEASWDEVRIALGALGPPPDAGP
jgi:tetratricopeptide (TPR) repeat protein